MPRARKTMSGEKAAAPSPIAGQEYGKGVQEMALEKALPAPQVNSPTAGQHPLAIPATPPTPAQAGSPSAPADVGSLAAAMAHRTNILDQPSARPDEPITHGLPSGPGGGPEVLGTSTASTSPLGDTLRNLSRITGDQYLAQLAMKAGL